MSNRCASLCALALAAVVGCGGELFSSEAEEELLGGEDETSLNDELNPHLPSPVEINDLDRLTLNLVREATSMGLAAGKDLVSEGLNSELARIGIEHTYIGGDSLVMIPDDAISQCPYVENASNDGSTATSCRMLAEQARDGAYVRETDTLASIELGPAFAADPDLHQNWLHNGLASGIDGEFLMAVRRLRDAQVCDQEPSPVESSREQGVAQGRTLMEQALEGQLAITPITVCDIDNGIVNPALNAAIAQVETTIEANPLCPDYEPTDMDDRAAFHQARAEYETGIRRGVEEGAVIAAEQLFRTWVCQTPQEEAGGGGDGGGGGGDPLVLDLDGDGVRTSGPARGVNFRLGETTLRRTGWIADPDDGLLAIDHNGNGRIDNGVELLGDQSWTMDGLTEQNGLLSLARYDQAQLGGNGDGVIDAQDAVYVALLVWRDRDLDGQTGEGELSTLSELGIDSIALDYVEGTNTLDSSFERADGSTGAAVDVWLRYF